MGIRRAGERSHGTHGVYIAHVDRWAGGLLYVALLIVHLDLALTMSGPVVYPDEGGYMAAAHYLATGRGLLHVSQPYHPGYSVLLAALIRLFPDPLRTYQAALILNALMLAGVGVGVFALTRYVLPNGSRAVRLLIGGLVGCYPSFLVYSNLVMSMNLFIPLFVGLSLAVARGLDSDQAEAWFVAGLLGGALYIVSPVGIVCVVAVTLATLFFTRGRRSRARATVATLLGLQLSLVPGILLLHDIVRADAKLAAPAARLTPTAKTAGLVSLTPAIPASPSAVSAPAPPTTAPQTRDRTGANAERLRTNLSLSHVGNDLAELAGQLFYLSAATYGLFVVGLAVAFAAAWRTFTGREPSSSDRLAAFVGVVMLATLASSTLRFSIGHSGGTESDELIYGRYNELVVAPILMLGLIGMARVRRRSRWVLVAWPLVVGAVLLASGALLSAGRASASLKAVFAEVNVLALHPLLVFFGGIHVVGIALIALGASSLLVLLARWGGVVAVTIPLLVASVLSASFSAHQLSRDSEGRKAERVVIDTVRTISATYGQSPSCIGYDVAIENAWHLVNDQFFLPDVRFRRFNPSVREQPCSSLALTGLWNLDALYPGARLITPENFSSTKLWVLPGALHDRLEQAGMLLPPRFPAVLPDSAFRSTLELVGVGRGADVLRRDTERDVVVSVTHRGSGSPWPPRLGFVSGNGWVRLAVIWLAVSDPRDPVGVGEADLPRTVFPGETVKVTVPLVPRGLDGAPLPPGRYVVRIGLVQDGYVFFSAKGDHTLDFAVSVGGPSAPAVH